MRIVFGENHLEEFEGNEKVFYAERVSFLLILRLILNLFTFQEVQKNSAKFSSLKKLINIKLIIPDF